MPPETTRAETQQSRHDSDAWLSGDVVPAGESGSGAWLYYVARAAASTP